MRNIFKRKEDKISPEFSTAMDRLQYRTNDIRAFGLLQKDIQIEHELIARSPNVTKFPVEQPLDDERLEKYTEIADVLGAVSSTVRIIPSDDKPYDYEADAEIS